MVTPLCDRIQSFLTTKTFGRPIFFVDQVTSTNTIALEAAQSGASHGTVILTNYQYQGLGRQGRTWISAYGLNLTFSVILDLSISTKSIGLVSLAASLGVADAIGEVTTPNTPQLKWPNDVLLNNKKICGILLQTTGSLMKPMILGIGINVNQTAFPQELNSKATSLLLATGQPVDRASLMASVLLHLEKSIELMVTKPSILRQIYSDHLIWIGKSCRVLGVNSEVRGTLIGIDQSGALMIDTKTGITTVFAGDVSLRMADH